MMTPRARRPTDEIVTSILDPHRNEPTEKTERVGELTVDENTEKSEGAPFRTSDVTLDEKARARIEAMRKPSPRRPAKETRRGVPQAGPEPAPKVEAAVPEKVPVVKSEPIQMISMKGAADAEGERRKRAAKEHKVQLRPMSEFRRADTQPQNLGRLAPPRDVREVNARRLHDLIVWGSVVVIVGCAVMLVVWFLAR